MTDTPRCGFDLKGGSICRLPGKGGDFCEDHIDRVCVGCAQRATRECRSGACPAVLCQWCTHLGQSRHGRPASQPEVVKQQMADAFEAILVKLDQEEILPSTGPQRAAAAPRLVEEIVLHTTLKVMVSLGEMHRERS